VELLNRSSVEKHYDAYADIDWNSSENQIDPRDPVWELEPEDDPIAGTDWYRSQTSERRRLMGLDRICGFLRVGSQFEDILVRGLLIFARTFPDEAPERRYVMHEAIEECHHIQMFREFLARSHRETTGLTLPMHVIGHNVTRLGRTRPALFFVFVMGGEDPIDYVQRRTLRAGRPLHPLLRQVIQMHVTEEARHLCFARSFLAEEVRTWGMGRRTAFGLAAAPILSVMCRLMLDPTQAFVDRYRIPRPVLVEAYGGERARAVRQESVRKIRELFRGLDLFPTEVHVAWRAAGIAA
jgi:hypothetical protein